MKKARTIISAIFLLTILLAGCAPAATPVPQTTAPSPVSLTVMAASSLTAPFTELGKAFEIAHPGVTVAFSFGGSQTLAQQLAEAAPADVFASASKKYMDAAVQSKRVAPDAVVVFARNRLVVITPASNPAGITALADLANPGLKLVLADKSVPAGQYSLDFLAKAAADASFPPGYQDSVLANVVSYENNVKAVVAKVSLGEADAGIAYVSDIAGDAGAKLVTVEIPEALNVIAAYPIAPIAGSAHPNLAQAFVDFVRSPKGQAILSKYGFQPA